MPSYIKQHQARHIWRTHTYGRILAGILRGLTRALPGGLQAGDN